MQPAGFDYHAPASLADATALLAQSNGDARIVAGGQSLLATMNLRLARPSALIDLRAIPGLDGIDIAPPVVRIGSRVTHAQIIASEALRTRLPILAQAGRHIGHATIRERGTFAGSLALADPAAEWPTVMLALEGRVHAVSVRGERAIPADAFFISYYTTALEADEIITGVELPLSLPEERHAFDEFARQSGAFALALVATKVRIDANRRIAAVRIALGGCGPRPLLISLPGLVGEIATRALFDKIVDAVELAPPSDIHASGEDRRELAITIIKRSLARACGLGA